jgi:hypothetical protein
VSLCVFFFPRTATDARGNLAGVATIVSHRRRRDLQHGRERDGARGTRSIFFLTGELTHAVLQRPHHTSERRAWPDRVGRDGDYSRHMGADQWLASCLTLASCCRAVSVAAARRANRLSSPSQNPPWIHEELLFLRGPRPKSAPFYIPPAGQSIGHKPPPPARHAQQLQLLLSPSIGGRELCRGDD